MMGTLKMVCRVSALALLVLMVWVAYAIWVTWGVLTDSWERLRPGTGN
jgi:hypothetical protein